MPSYIEPPSDEEDSESASFVGQTRRRFMQAAGAIGLTSLASLAGCQGGNSSQNSSGNTDGLTKVPTITIAGETKERGIVHYVLKNWADHVNENTPFNVDFQPMKHTQVVQKLMFQQSVSMGSLTFGPRPSRLDPNQMLNDVYNSDNIGCGSYQWTSYSDKDLDELLNKQVSTMDRDKRQNIVYEIQKKLSTLGGDVKFGSVRPLIHPEIVQLYNKNSLKNVTVVKGIGIRNIWTYNEMTPKNNLTQVVIPFTEGANNLTPLFSGPLNIEAVRNVYDKLVQIGPNAKPKPWLATDWTVSDDNKTIKFNIRKNHSFHDGTPLTSEDVKFTYEFMEKSPYLATAVDPIKSAKTLDDSTIEFSLAKPFAPIFLFTFGRVPIIPKHIWEGVPGNKDVSSAVKWSPSSENKFFGSGHFKFDHWRKGSEIALKANNDHFSPPSSDKIVFRVVKSSQAALDSMANKDAQLLFSSDASRDVIAKTGKENDHLAIERNLSVGNHPLIFNTNAPPLGFPAVRAALESVAPKKTIANNVWNGYAKPAFGNISPATSFWNNPDAKKWGMEYTGKDEFTDVLKNAGFTLMEDGVYFPKGKEPDHMMPLGCEVHQEGQNETSS